MSVIKKPGQDHLDNAVGTYNLMRSIINQWIDCTVSTMETFTGEATTQDRLTFIRSMSGLATSLKMCHAQIESTVNMFAGVYAAMGIPQHKFSLAELDGKHAAQTAIVEGLGEQYAKAVDTAKLSTRQIGQVD